MYLKRYFYLFKLIKIIIILSYNKIWISDENEMENRKIVRFDKRVPVWKFENAPKAPFIYYLRESNRWPILFTIALSTFAARKNKTVFSGVAPTSGGHCIGVRLYSHFVRVWLPDAFSKTLSAWLGKPFYVRSWSATISVGIMYLSATLITVFSPLKNKISSEGFPALFYYNHHA